MHFAITNLIYMNFDQVYTLSILPIVLGLDAINNSMIPCFQVNLYVQFGDTA
jgi:hypothetical protein